MKNNSKQILFGVLLILAGIVFLLQQLLNISLGHLFVAMVFAAAGFVFLYVVFRNRENWWALIPGFTLLGLGTLIASGDLFPSFSDHFGGSLFLGSIALSFVAILILNPSRWWAVIPAGTLATLAVIAAIQEGNGLVQGGVFFLGISATFATVGLLPAGHKEIWPWIPAGICFIVGALILIGSGALANPVFGWVWAIAFLGAGIFLVLRSFIKKE
ncbi:MAG: hypothetical protein NTZ74_13360 [Chloroflexi bacterium]|nr:hypothetical protein [Chloroflexota bacterium]